MSPEHLPIAEAASVVAGVVIPYLVALATKLHAPALVKDGLALALSALAGAINATVFMTGERWQDYVLAIGTAWVTALATHVTTPVRVTAARTAAVGVGRGGVAKAP